MLKTKYLKNICYSVYSIIHYNNDHLQLVTTEATKPNTKHFHLGIQ